MVDTPRKYANPARRRYGNVVAIPSRGAGLPEAPEHLAEPERELWASICATFTMDDAASLSVLQAAMECRARARSCREAIDREGQTVASAGVVKPHPLMAAENHAHGAFLQCMKHLRLDIA